MTPSQAAKEARLILEDEANELTCLVNAPGWEALPHRAKVAIQRETWRLREIAKLLPVNDGQEVAS